MKLNGGHRNKVEQTQSLPAMSSDTTPSGYTTSQQTETYQPPAWYLFSQIAGTDWYSGFNDDGGGGYIPVYPFTVGRTFPYPMRFGAYSLIGQGNTVAWSLVGVKVNGDTINLDAQPMTMLGLGQETTYTIPATLREPVLRVNLVITSSSGGSIGEAHLSELKLFKVI